MLYFAEYISKTKHFSEGRIERELVGEDVYGEEFEDAGKREVGYTPKAKSFFKPHRFKGKIELNMTKEEIQLVVNNMGLVDKEGHVITHADINEPHGPFWNHLKCGRDVPLKGDIFDDENIVDRFMLEVFRTKNNILFPDEQEQPSTMRSIDWRVTQVKEGVKSVEAKVSQSFDLVLQVNELSEPKKRLFMSVIGEDDKEMGNVELAKVIYQTLVSTPDALTVTDQRVDTFFEILCKSEMNVLVAYDTFAKGKLHSFINLTGGYYKFKDIVLGQTIEESINHLSVEANEETLRAIQATLDNE